ncbi:hypothetical protein TCAL_11232 [Tigriopus californicus]|uniref:Glutathione peroxidase n=1 Tax=Tigriopus californicus TaxID=6832 RepID=A0A553N8T4_TIGCA|nr:hypothetical protein TCAL_11232 [Tigriopus californicus]
MASTTARRLASFYSFQAKKLDGKEAVLAFPSNQFGHQENSNGQEILNALRHVRPGNGFEPKCVLFDKIIINGEGEHPVFSWLKTALPMPFDDTESLMGDPKFIIWKPVKRSDVAWNFEKFLVSPGGEPVKRYSKGFETINIAKDIDSLLQSV